MSVWLVNNSSYMGSPYNNHCNSTYDKSVESDHISAIRYDLIVAVAVYVYGWLILWTINSSMLTCWPAEYSTKYHFGEHNKSIQKVLWGSYRVVLEGNVLKQCQKDSKITTFIFPLLIFHNINTFSVNSEKYHFFFQFTLFWSIARSNTLVVLVSMNDSMAFS